MLYVWFISSIFIKILRGCDCKYWVPSFSNSICDCATMKTEPLRPFCGAESFSFVGYFKVIGLVSVVSFRKHPSAIFWRVVSISINPIKLMFFGRSFAHIFDEVPKIVSPSFADLNSFSSIVMKLDEFGVITAKVHVIPRFVTRVFYHRRHSSSPFFEIKNILSRRAICV